MTESSNTNIPLERTENAPTPRQMRMAYTLAKYEQMRLESNSEWQPWQGLRDLVSAGLSSGVNMGDSLINELCKIGQMEQRPSRDGSGLLVKRRYDAPNIA